MIPLFVNILGASIFLAVLIFGIYALFKCKWDSEVTDWIIGIGIIGIVLWGTFGFGWYGSSRTQYTKDVKVKPTHVEVVKTSTTVYVEIDGKVYMVTEHVAYENLSDTTEFYYRNEYNIYNVNHESTLYYIDEVGESQEL